MTDRLILTIEVRDAIVSHAQEGAARAEEICGILVGERNPDVDRVTSIRRIPNVADVPRTRYELDPETTLDVIESVESQGDDVVGFYHSHPDGPPRPSPTDRAQATWTGYIYLIVSLAEDVTVDAWRWTGEEFETVRVQVADEKADR